MANIFLFMGLLIASEACLVTSNALKNSGEPKLHKARNALRVSGSVAVSAAAAVAIASLTA